MTTVILNTEDDWRAFVDANEAAIIEVCGDLEAAWLQAGNGGFRLGGGAAPLVEVRFAHTFEERRARVEGQLGE